MFRLIVSTSFVATVLSLFSGVAMAAPQVLAVLSTGNGAAMECEGDTCKASLSTYCLQRDRESPFEGTVYHAANPERYTLVLDFADGTEKILDIGEQLSFVSTRGFKAVSASISRDLILDHGALGARLIVAAEASLIPEADPDDLNPLTEDDIALATGPLRNLGARVLDDRADAEVARTLGTMVRAVPEWQGWAQLTTEELAVKISVIASQEKVSVEGQERIQREFDSCEAVYDAHKTYSVGYCLLQRHDEVLLDLNKRYWETQAGS